MSMERATGHQFSLPGELDRQENGSLSNKVGVVIGAPSDRPFIDGHMDRHVTLGRLQQEGHPSTVCNSESEDVPDRSHGASPSLLHAGALAASGLAWLLGARATPLASSLSLGLLYGLSLFAAAAWAAVGAARPELQRPPPSWLVTGVHLAIVAVEATWRASQGRSGSWERAALQLLALQCSVTELGGWSVASALCVVALAVVMALAGQLGAAEIAQSLLLPCAAMCALAVAAGGRQATTQHGWRLWLASELHGFAFGSRRATDRMEHLEMETVAELWPDDSAGTKEAMVEKLKVALAKLKLLELPPLLAKALKTMLQQILRDAKGLDLGNPIGSLPPIDEAPAEVQEFVMDLLPSSLPQPARGPGTGQQRLTTQSYDDAVVGLLEPFGHLEELGWEPMLVGAERQLGEAHGKWGGDLFAVASKCGQRPLRFVGQEVFRLSRRELRLEKALVEGFLEHLEGRYRASNPYHNSIHAADVLNSMLYFTELRSSSLHLLTPAEKLAAFTAAAAHDVGHDGRTNRFHTVVETPLAQLFNEQSCLENMHCAITFAILRSNGASFLQDFDSTEWAQFRSTVVLMILDTDLSKHFQALSAFRKDFLEGTPPALDTLKHRQQLLSMVLKACDVGASAKPFAVHVQWTTRINDEFYRQGDEEKALGLAPSPFCDRLLKNVEDSQKVSTNQEFWETVNASDFNYEEPVSNIPKLMKKFTLYQMRATRTSRSQFFSVRATERASAIHPRTNTAPSGQAMPTGRGSSAGRDPAVA